VHDPSVTESETATAVDTAALSGDSGWYTRRSWRSRSRRPTRRATPAPRRCGLRHLRSALLRDADVMIDELRSSR